MSEVEELPTH